MYLASDIRQVHLEITTRCSARCPQCPRNLGGGAVNPMLPMAELSLAQVERIMPKSFVEQLNHICICGNYGDPTAARDTLATLRYFRTCHSQLSLQINSHGSARPEAWWKELAAIGARCHFGIDGLETSNHIYRQGTEWGVIMRNAAAFIAAGGDAAWDFIVFAHNELEVEKARALSEQMGFRRFVVKKSGRFLRNNGKPAPAVEVRSLQGEIIGHLAPPTVRSYQNDALVKLSADFGSAGRYQSYLESTPISCKAIEGKSIYISAEGLVLPCCYLGHIYPPHPNLGSSQVSAMLDRLPGGHSAISGLNRTIAEIVGGPLFQESIPSGWKAKNETRLQICAQQCGSCDILSAQRL